MSGNLFGGRNLAFHNETSIVNTFIVNTETEIGLISVEACQ